MSDAGSWLRGGNRHSTAIGAEHSRMDVAAAADRAGVPELRRDRINGTHDVPLERGVRGRFRQIADGFRREHGPCPCPEVLRRERTTGDLTQVRVHSGGIDTLPLSLSVEILKQRLAGQLAQLPDDARERSVADFDRLHDATLGAEMKYQRCTLDLHVLIEERSKTERLV